MSSKAAEHENPPFKSGKFCQLVAVMMNKTQETKERFNREYSGWPILFLFFTAFGIKSHNSRCASGLKSWCSTPHRARGFACPKPLASPRTPRRSRNPRWLMKQIGYTQDSHPCSTFEPRHPCLGYANLQQRQRRLRRGNWCNSSHTELF